MSLDVAVVGAGHNGLVAASYLARAGLKVKVFERRHVVGGAAVTEEFHPGFRNSVCSYAVSLLSPRVHRELDLAGHGLELVPRPGGNYLAEEDGPGLLTHGDPAKFREEVARTSARDADALDAFEAQLGRLADALRAMTLETPPNAGGGLGDLWALAKAARRVGKLKLADQQAFADIFTESAADYLDRWFESAPLKALLAFDGIVGHWGSPLHPGTAYVLLHHCFGQIMGPSGAWGHAIGGMGAISDALAKSARAAGAEIETGAGVAALLLDDRGRAAGLRLDNGREVRARAVAAAVNPKLLFERLLPAEVLHPAFRERMRQYKCRSGVLRMNVALSELPDFRGRPGKEPQAHHLSGINLCPTVDYQHRAFEDARTHGWSRRPVVELLIPSTMDTTLAPKGQHVASLFCQWFDYELPDGRSWDDARDAAADAVIDLVSEFAPNFRRSVIARQVLTPLDLEREFGLVNGDIFHGSLQLNQLWSARPALGHAAYAMPVANLWLCASGAHPGGGVTGLPGHNAAREMLKVLRPASSKRNGPK